MIEKRNVEIVNLTKGTLNFMCKDGSYIKIPSYGEAKVDIQRVETNVDGYYYDKQIKVNETRISKIKGLPPQNDNYIYIVPMLVYQTCYHERTDVYIIDEPIKEGGNTRVAKALSRPMLTSVQENFRKINDILTHIDFEDKTSVINSIYNAKVITDIYSK